MSGDTEISWVWEIVKQISAGIALILSGISFHRSGKKDRNEAADRKNIKLYDFVEITLKIEELNRKLAVLKEREDGVIRTYAALFEEVEQTLQREQKFLTEAYEGELPQRLKKRDAEESELRRSFDLRKAELESRKKGKLEEIEEERRPLQTELKLLGVKKDQITQELKGT